MAVAGAVVVSGGAASLGGSAARAVLLTAGGTAVEVLLAGVSREYANCTSTTKYVTIVSSSW